MKERPETITPTTGVTFEIAKRVFQDPLARERLDDRQDYREERWILTGSAGTAILTIAYTDRGGRHRLISARPATKDEVDDYYTGFLEGLI